ncbi:MAG: hypothetical protein J3K34DRAFT_431343 [Monoraphidium minutum]|nr:MAG: hypothetical protein J3K34DRAFT_431343 [Monoraphidium minutum]
MALAAPPAAQEWTITLTRTEIDAGGQEVDTQRMTASKWSKYDSIAAFLQTEGHATYLDKECTIRLDSLGAACALTAVASGDAEPRAAAAAIAIEVPPAGFPPRRAHHRHVLRAAGGRGERLSRGRHGQRRERRGGARRRPAVVPADTWQRDRRALQAPQAPP